MRRFAPCFALWGLLASLLPAAAAAQSMFLDTDGDGAPTAADVIAPAGVTTLAVWIRTDVNRDGSAATCATADGDLTISGYEFVLRASNGTVSWGAVSNQIGAFGFVVSPDSNDVDLHAGAYGADQPPGAYLLATVELTVASGTPRVDVVPDTPLSGSYFTGFGSSCSGVSYTNTLTLGVDWFDVDGAAYGGSVNHAPSIEPVPDLTVTETDVLEQALVAHDEDGDAITFTKQGGPAYATVETTDPGSGVAQGLLRLTPGYADSGAAVVSIGASDGIVATSASTTVHVLDRDRPPSLDPVADMTAVVGRPTVQDLHASDPDGGALSFRLVAGPEYATVTTVDPFSPATGRVTLDPGTWDSLADSATVAATDGTLEARRSFAIFVIPAIVGSPLLCRPNDMTVVAGTVAEQTLRASIDSREPIAFSLAAGPSFASVATESMGTWPEKGLLRLSPSLSDVGVHAVQIRASAGLLVSEDALRVTVVDRLSAPDLAPDPFDPGSRSYDVCQYPQSVVFTDLDEDGLVDIITPNLGCGISIRFGTGSGRFERREDIPVPGNPIGAAAADFDGDGHVDVAVANGLGDQIVILRGDGTGALTFDRAFTAGPNAVDVAAHDLNRDGFLDLVVANMNANSITVFLGTGGGAFDGGTLYGAGRTPCYTEIDDLNHDGVEDLVVANEESDAVSLYLGRGDGTFEERGLLATAAGPAAVGIADFDQDGNPDIAAAGFHTRYVTILFGDGSGGFGRRLDVETGLGPWSVFVGDLNGDGHSDFATANTGDGDVTIRIGRGDGTFDPARSAGAGNLSRYVNGSDVNGDRRMDLVVANEGGASVSVLLGDGSGAFGPPASAAGFGFANGLSIGDLNGDGALDVAAPVLATKEVAVYPGSGHGTLDAAVRIATPGTPGRAEIADLNGDGVGDLIVTLQDAAAIVVSLGGSSLPAGPPTTVPVGFSTGYVAAGDWNEDGRTDVAVGGTSQATASVLFGDGSGGFSGRLDLTLPAAPTGLAAGDWDGDGHPDLAVAMGSFGARVFWGDGSGLSPGPDLYETTSVTGIAAGDLRHEGRATLILTTVGTFGGNSPRTPHGLLVTYRWPSRDAPPARSFLPSGAGAGFPHVADVNRDGFPDLLLDEAGPSGVGVFEASSDGALGPRRDYGAGSLAFGLAVGDLNGDGSPDAVVSHIETGDLTVLLNRGAGSADLAARAFVLPDDRVLRLQSAKPTLCVHLEPVEGDFAISDVEPGSIRLAVAGGDEEPIAPTIGKRMVVADADRNGVAEWTACFAKEDLRTAFAGVHGTTNEGIVLTGRLVDGRAFRATMTLAVVGTPGGPLAAWIAPNPSNPSTALTFTTARAGHVRVTLFDVHGRAVATVLDEKAAEPGTHHVLIGAERGRGGDLASGVYFYRIDAPEGTANGRFVILK